MVETRRFQVMGNLDSARTGKKRCKVCEMETLYSLTEPEGRLYSAGLE
jgi:hypothetical protein